MRPPRVLFVGAFPPPGHAIFGGMVTSCRALLASNLPRRVQLDLLDSTQISNPPPGLPMRAVLAAARFLRFVRRFETNRPDIVLLFVAVGASIVEKGAMARYARLRGVPVIMFPRGGSIVEDCRRSAFTRAWAGFFFRGASRLICQAESWRQFALDTLGFAPGHVIVIRNWTATADLLAIGGQRPSAPPSTLRVLFVGWVDRAKGVFELLEACRQLIAGRRFTLALVGDGNAMAEARALVERHGMTEYVHFRGWLDEPGLHRALLEADVFVLPSWAEGLPNAMVEAMAARLPVVVTRVGAVPELIEDHRSGLLIEPHNAESLRRALAAVLDDATLRERLASEGQALATREFGVETAVDRIVGQIEGTIAAARGGAPDNDRR
ncbi:MAG: glycosyltransferase family 4 protein [Gammaproteobacteria bacterium]